jgi:vitamin B12 transporter
MRIFPSALFGAVVLIFPVASLTAQQLSPGLDEVIVTSSRIPTPLRHVGTSVSVLTEEEIKSHGNLALVDVLRQMPGIGSTGGGGAGQPTSLRIRGEEGFRTLTLFDGMRLLDPSLPQIGPQIEQLLSGGVDRVEVLRGPQGLGYGADAGGVVNIFSRRDSEGMLGELQLESGEFDTRQVSGSVSGRSGPADFYLSAVDLSTNGINSRRSDTVLADEDGYDNTTLHGRLGYQLSDNWRLDLVHRDVTGESEFDGCFRGTTVHDCDSMYGLQSSRLAVEYKADGFGHQLSYATTETSRKSYASGQFAFGNEGSLERLEYTGSMTRSPGFNLVYGLDREKADNGNGSRDNTGAYLEYLGDFSDSLFFTAGLRHDDNDDFGTNTSYRVSAAYLLTLNNDALLKFRTAFGTGFRAPSLFEIEYNSGPFAFPPAALVLLRQETSEGFELGVEYLAGPDLRLELVFFDQQVEDAIFFDLSGFSGYLQDLGSSQSEGVEFSAAYALSANLELSGNYTYNDTERPDGQQRIRRPRNLANLGLTYRAIEDRLAIHAYYRMSRDSIDEVFGAVTPLDDFEVLDLNISYQLTDSVRLVGRVENATDARYQEIIDYNTPGRAYYVGVDLKLR